MSEERIQGGAMAGVEDLYREVILDHFRSPKNRGALDAANAKAEGLNPLCGDQLTMAVLVDGNRVKDVKFEGHGCAISQSAASMLTVAVKGRNLDDVKHLVTLYKSIFGIEDGTAAGETSADDLGDLVALEGVKKYPVRIKCALLSANTLLEALENSKKGA